MIWKLALAVAGQRAEQGGSGDERRFGRGARLESSSRVSVLVVA